MEGEISQLSTKSLVYDDIIDTSTIQNILLIDSNITDFQQYANVNTFPIIYNRMSTREQMLEVLSSKFQNISRIAVVSHFEESPYFLNNELLFLDANTQFMIDIIRQFNVLHVDYLACSTLHSQDWKDYYTKLYNATGILIGASDNNTGNLKYGGDWILESTQEDIQTIYFNDLIQNYSSLLVIILKDGIRYSTLTETTASVSTHSNAEVQALSGIITILSTVTDTDSLLSYTVNTIVLRAFFLCNNMTFVTIPNSVTLIASMAFYGCWRLTSITIPSSVNSIAIDAFRECKALNFITVDPSNAYYSNDEYGVFFNKSQTILKKYSVGNIRTSYTIPITVTSFDDYAFNGGGQLTSITIPNSVTSIGINAFYGCTSLTSITIPSSVTNISDSVFYECTLLKNVYFYGNYPIVNSNNFINNISDTAYYISGATGFNTIPAGFTSKAIFIRQTPPTNVQFISLTSTTTLISWTPTTAVINTPTETGPILGYRITYYITSTPTIINTSSLITDTSFTVAGLTIGASYTFTVAAYNNVGPSTEVVALPPPPPPPTLTAILPTINLGIVYEDSSNVVISYDRLNADTSSNSTISTVNAFIVKTITSGLLTIGVNPWNAVTNCTIDASNTAYWTPVVNANGTLAAFTIVARDALLAQSITSLTVNVVVTAVNDAPIASGTATLTPSILEDDSNPTGATISTLFSSNFSDATDTSANTLAGVAITNYIYDSTKGNWQYSEDGSTNWTIVPQSGITISNAYTLKSSDYLRFLPVTNWSGAAPTLTVTLIESPTTVTTAANIFITTTGGTTTYSSVSVVLSHSVTAVNDAPTIIYSSSTVSGSVSNNTPITGQLTATDVDLSGALVWDISGETTSSYGSISIDSATGIWTYTLNTVGPAYKALKKDTSTDDIFTARVKDDLLSSESQITITVIGINDPPKIIDTSSNLVGTVFDSSLNITAKGTIVARDMDLSSNLLRWDLSGSQTKTSNYGTMKIDNSGNWTYDLSTNSLAYKALKKDASYNDEFTAYVYDDLSLNDNKTINITVIGINDKPEIKQTISNLTGTVPDISLNTTVKGTIVATDVDLIGNFRWDLSGSQTKTSNYGTMKIDNSGNWTYDLSTNSVYYLALKKDASDNDAFTAYVYDDLSLNDNKPINITVIGINDKPEINPTISNLTGTVFDSSLNKTAKGTIVATDVDLSSNLLRWDLSGSQTKTSNYGTMKIDNSGNWTYDLSTNSVYYLALKKDASDNDAFTAYVYDDLSLNDNKPINITVIGINDKPEINPTISNLTGTVFDSSLNKTAKGTIVATDVDLIGNFRWDLSGTQTQSGTYGTMTIDNSGNWTYDLIKNAAYNALKKDVSANDTFTVYVYDDLSLNNHTFINIRVIWINDPPKIIDTSSNLVGTVFDSSLNTIAKGTIVAKDMDLIGNFRWDLSGSQTQPGTYGTMTIDNSGNWTYDLSTNSIDYISLKRDVSEYDMFTVYVYDDLSLNDHTFINITVIGINDKPKIDTTISNLTGTVSDISSIATGKIFATDVDVSGNFSWDLSGSQTKTGTYGTMTIDNSGNWTYDLSRNSIDYISLKRDVLANDTFTAYVYDEMLEIDFKTINITVIGQNKTPLISGDISGNVLKDGSLNATGILTATDEDLIGKFKWDVSGGKYGTISTIYSGIKNNIATWTYDLCNNKIQFLSRGQSTTDTFNIRVWDDMSKNTTQPIIIKIYTKNDQIILLNKIPNQSIDLSSNFSYVIPSNTFLKNETTTLSYTAKLSNNKDLPEWLLFDSTTGEFTSTSTHDETKKRIVGPLSIKVTATDEVSSSYGKFIINVLNEQAISGTVLDGYIKNGTITVRDLSNNYIAGPIQTDLNGNYSLPLMLNPSATYIIDCSGGTDIATKNPILYTLSAIYTSGTSTNIMLNASNIIVTPLTTIVTDIVESNPDLYKNNISDVYDIVANAFGLQPNLMNIDYLYAQNIVTGIAAVKIATITKLLSSATNTDINTIKTSIAKYILNHSGGLIFDASFISEVVSDIQPNLLITETLKTNLTNIITTTSYLMDNIESNIALYKIDKNRVTKQFIDLYKISKGVLSINIDDISTTINTYGVQSLQTLARAQKIGQIAQNNLLDANICFVKGTKIVTDQGIIEIQNITVLNTIRGKKIVMTTKTRNIDNYLIEIKKNAFFENVPNEDTYMTGEHCVFLERAVAEGAGERGNSVDVSRMSYNNKMVKAKDLVNNTTILKIYTENQEVYNLVLEGVTSGKMIANNLIAETLDPKSMIVKILTVIKSKNFSLEEECEYIQILNSKLKKVHEKKMLQM